MADVAGPSLDVALAASHHLLAVAQDVAPEEVEALAVSRSARAGWRGPSELQLCAGASLTGPWQVDERARRAFDLPAWCRHAYLLRCPVQRTGPLPAELAGTDELLDAFPHGLPTGVEAEALDHLRAMARRLRGAVRVAGTGAVVEPEPDSAVDLTVASTVWLEPEACRQVLAPVLTGVRSLLEESGQDPGAPTRDRTAVDGSGPRAAAVRSMDPDERAWIHAEADAFDAAALGAEQVLTGYGLLAELPGHAVGHGGAVEISVVGSEHVPTALRDVPWARDGVISYELRWHPPEPELAYVRRPPLGVRRDRAAAAGTIERATAALVAVVGGEVLDDDGFLVDPATLQR